MNKRTIEKVAALVEDIRNLGKATRRKPWEGKLFLFTEEDEAMIAAAVKSANEFMEKYGKGKEPRKPGMYYRDGEKPEPTIIYDED